VRDHRAIALALPCGDALPRLGFAAFQFAVRRVSMHITGSPRIFMILGDPLAQVVRPRFATPGSASTK